MKEITLSKNRVALIDDDDFERVSKLHWSTTTIRNKNNSYTYVINSKQINFVRKVIYLHRFILNAPDDKWVDHIDGNTLDCRKSNLRLCSTRQNNQNQRVVFGVIKYKGVHKSGTKYRARIRLSNGNRFNIGSFDTPEDAAKAYDQKAMEDRGEFAIVNFDVNGNFNSSLIFKQFIP